MQHEDETKDRRFRFARTVLFCLTGACLVEIIGSLAKLNDKIGIKPY